MTARYLLRVCMPARDWPRVTDVLASIENAQTLSHTVNICFPERPDLAVVETVMILECEPRYALEVRKELSRRTRGTIGFYAIYRIRKP